MMHRLVFMIMLVLIGASIPSCKTSKKIVDIHERKDSTSVLTDSVSESYTGRFTSEQEHHNTVTQDTLMAKSVERNDTMVRTFVDHYIHTQDSVAVQFDSITGNYTFHYYTRTYERETVHDTTNIMNTLSLDTYNSHSLTDSLRTKNMEIDLLRTMNNKLVIMYKETKDSLDRKEDTVREKPLYLIDKIKVFFTSVIMIILITTAVYMWYKAKK